MNGAAVPAGRRWLWECRDCGTICAGTVHGGPHYPTDLPIESFGADSPAEAVELLGKTHTCYALVER